MLLDSLTHGASPSTKMEKGLTALMIGATRGLAEIVETW